jgi:hypothetical protein
MVMNRIRAYFAPNKELSGSSSPATIRHYCYEHGVQSYRRQWLQGALRQQTTVATARLRLHAASPSPDHLQLNQIATLRLTGRTPHVRRGDKLR